MEWGAKQQQQKHDNGFIPSKIPNANINSRNVLANIAQTLPNTNTTAPDNATARTVNILKK